MKRLAHVTCTLARLYAFRFTAALFGAPASARCAFETVSSTTFIGVDKNVKLVTSHCDDEPVLDSNGRYVPVRSIEKRQSSNVCGADCAYSMSFPC